MKKLILFTLIAMSVTACASTTYRKPGATDEEFDQAHTDCEVKANQAGYGTQGFAQAIAYKKFIKRCMNGSGWKAE